MQSVFVFQLLLDGTHENKFTMSTSGPKGDPKATP